MAVLRSPVCGLLALAAAACVSPPQEPDPNAEARVEALLSRCPTKTELSQFVGALPLLCWQTSPTQELCQWTAGNQLPSWRSMAQAIGTGDRVNLICDLPLSGEPRAAGSCSIHPRRSNRYSWKINTGNTRGPQGQEAVTEARERYRQTADRWLAEADTLERLARLMGALPDQCMARPDGEQVCVWHTTDQTFGQGTLAMWIDASVHKKIRLRCTLPSDGSPRAPGSCVAEVGA